MRSVQAISRLPRRGTFSRKLEKYEKTAILVPERTLSPRDLEIHQADLDEIRICYSTYGGGGRKNGKKYRTPTTRRQNRLRRFRLFEFLANALLRRSSSGFLSSLSLGLCDKLAKFG